ncbi:MAG: hypothetical protein NVS3B26_30480 [Mycobacteriales bacterium]
MPGVSLGDEIDEAATTKTQRLGKIADLLERNGIAVEDVGRVQKVNLWQGFHKGEDGTAQVVDLTGITLSPSWEDGPKWPVVQQAAPTKIAPTKVQRVARGPGDLHTAVILPDPQIGYRRDLTTGQLDPFHDEHAIALAMQVVARVKPDLIINLGDTIDLAEFSRFEQEPGFALTTQASLDAAHRFLASQRATAPHAEIRLIEGNHDRRLTKFIIANAKAACYLRPAATPPSTWPVMSVPHLLRLDDLGVSYVEGYPAGITWINDRLACVHGERLKVSQVVDEERVSVIQGHIHRLARQHKTWRVRDGSRTTLAASPGCLCRIDGSVPSTKGSTDSFGNAIKRPEDWQHGVGVVTYIPGDGPFQLELIPLHGPGETTFFRGEPLAAPVL